MEEHGESERAERFRRRLKVAHASEIQRQTFYALENIKKANLPAKIVGAALFVLIVANAVIVFVSAQPGLDPVAADVIQGFYKFSTLCFCVEYIARIWIADLAFGKGTPAQARWRYIRSPLGIIDLLSFAPNMVAWFVPVTPALLNAISILRLVRLVKISRYMRGLRTIGRVISKHYHEIVAAFLVILLLIVVSSVVMYELEHPAQPKEFDNLLSGAWWAVETVTGTGYGDIVPVTFWGRFVGGIIMLLSVALVAIPGGIFSAGFVAEFQNANLRKIERDMRREDAKADADRASRAGKAPDGAKDAAVATDVRQDDDSAVSSASHAAGRAAPAEDDGETEY